jgi:uncharacterized protein (DUF362 family)
MTTLSGNSRRQFLKTSVLGGIAALTCSPLRHLEAAAPAPVQSSASRVALTAGNERADIVYRGLNAFKQQITRAIGDRRIVIKPNNVAIDVPLCATHADCLEATLEFLKSIGKLENVVIAESAANGPTLDGFANYGYDRLAGKYRVKMLDLDQEGFELVHVFDEKDFAPHPVRMSRLLLDPNNFVISATRLKTHDRVLATLSLKNIVFGAPIKDEGFRWGKASKPGAKNDKPIAHGSGIRGINYNLFALSQRLHPHLAILDGYEGMQGNGPVFGTPVDHKVALVSLDWLAADRIGLELMGIDYAKVGYLNYCARARLGEGDIEKIEIVGEPIASHVKSYKLADNIEKQLIWMQPAKA